MRGRTISAPREARRAQAQAGDTAIAIDDIASIAKKAGDVIMEIYNGTSAEVRGGGRQSAPLPFCAALTARPNLGSRDTERFEHPSVFDKMTRGRPLHGPLPA